MRWYLSKSQLIWLCIPFISALTSVHINAETAYAQVSSIITQMPTSSGGSAVKMDQIDILKNIQLSDTKDKLICQLDGVYLVMALGQVGSTVPGSSGYMDCWFSKNNVSIDNSASRVAFDPAAPTTILSVQFIIKLSKGDTLATIFSASGPSIGFLYLKPDNEPAISSFELSMVKIE